MTLFLVFIGIEGLVVFEILVVSIFHLILIDEDHLVLTLVMQLCAEFLHVFVTVHEGILSRDLLQFVAFAVEFFPQHILQLIESVPGDRRDEDHRQIGGSVSRSISISSSSRRSLLVTARTRCLSSISGLNFLSSLSSTS